MQVELIPVIEVNYEDSEIIAPNKYPYWEYSELWDKYHSDCYKKAGFHGKLTPHVSGSSFYRLADIPDTQLKKMVIDQTQGLRDGTYARAETCSFFGGYVLRVDGQDKYFPQCCGELSDIKYWENISNGKHSYYEGHPAPKIEFINNTIVFDFSVDNSSEMFQPPPPEIILKVERLELLKSVALAKNKLLEFELRLNKINTDENLNIDNIGALLIYENANYN